MWLYASTFMLVEAQASAFFLSISQPQLPGVGATWSFPLVTDEGWFLASGQGGDLTLAPMDENGVVDMSLVETLTDVGTINDHALRPCFGGGYLYVASTGVFEDNLVYRWDDAFLTLGDDVIEQGDPLHAGNDTAAICSESFVLKP